MGNEAAGKEDHLRAALIQAVRDWPAEALLLSGGLDSALLAALDSTSVAITVGLADDRAGGCARCAGWDRYPDGCGADLAAAREVEARLGLRWESVVLSRPEALAVLRDLVRLRRSFDLGLLNDIPIYAGLRRAAERGRRTAWTGDDADSLFGGYSFLRAEPDWGAYLERRLPTIAPSATAIGAALGVEVRYPYLHPAVVAVARSLTRNEVEVWRAGPAGAFVDQFEPALMARPVKPWGKAVLRRVAAPLLPPATAWRPKTDLQFGSGMCRLETDLTALVTDSARVAFAKAGLRFFNDAHRGLRLIFDELGLQISPPADDEAACRACGAGVPRGRRHCATCGAYPA